MSKRKLASNIILFLFFVLVASAALFSNIFQNSVKSGSQMIEQAKLFTQKDLSFAQKITLKNKAGEFIFEKNDNNQITPWHMSVPRDISANSVFIETLIKSLTDIKVKKLFPDEKINITNFSIDKPTAILNLINPNGDKTTIQFGLMNTIDNSTYLKISGKPGIYHVEAPSVSLENATLLDLIESQIITLNLETIESFRIFKGSKKIGQPTLEISKKNNEWFDTSGEKLSLEKVDEYFQDLSTLKSSFIIDKQTEAQRKQISSLSKNADFIISIKDNLNNILDYSISPIIRSLSDIDLKNEDYFVVTISNNTTAYIVKKDFFELFTKKADSFKELQLQQKQ